MGQKDRCYCITGIPAYKANEQDPDRTTATIAATISTVLDMLLFRQQFAGLNVDPYGASVYAWKYIICPKS
jgi:hypothetical protein